MVGKLNGVQIDAHEKCVFRNFLPVIAVQVCPADFKRGFGGCLTINFCRNILYQGTTGCHIHSLHTETKSGYKIFWFVF